MVCQTCTLPRLFFLIDDRCWLFYSMLLSVCIYIYISLETLLFLYHRSSCLRFGSCRSPDLKGLSLCCSWNHGGLHLLDSRNVRGGDGHAGTQLFPLLLHSKSQFCLLFPCLGTCLAAFSVVTSEFKMVFHV